MSYASNYDQIDWSKAGPPLPEKRPLTGKTYATGAGWPIVSDAGAVNPKDREAAIAHDKLHGVTTNYTKDGQPVFENREHRRRWQRLHKIIDLNSYTGY